MAPLSRIAAAAGLAGLLAGLAAAPAPPQAPAPCRGTFALAIEGGENDANLNGRLVRYALDGTGREVLLEGAADVFPQADGSLLAKRRTSRSGHDLLRVPAAATERAAVIGAAFDVVDAAAGPDGRAVAAIVRTGPQLAWQVAFFALPPAVDPPRAVDLPEGLRPERIHWRPKADPDNVDPAAGHPIVLAGKVDGRPARFGLAGPDGAPRWETLPAYVESEDDDFILSKSHSLGVEQIDLDGRPAVRVAYFWWHGAVEDIAVFKGMVLEGFQWACGRGAVFVAGRDEDGHTAKIVELREGRVLTAVSGARAPVKLLKPAAR